MHILMICLNILLKENIQHKDIKPHELIQIFIFSNKIDRFFY